MIAKAEDYARVIAASHYVNNFDADAGFAGYVSAAPIAVQGVANLVTVPFLVYFFLVVYSTYVEMENYDGRSISRNMMRPWKAPPATKAELATRASAEVPMGKPSANKH